MFSRALSPMQFSACTRISKHKHAINRAIILFTQHPHYLLFFSIIECSVLMALVFYYKDVRKGNDAKNRAIFSLFVTEKTQLCNACAVSQKVDADCFSRNVPISNNPVVRISRNLAKNRQKPLFKPCFYPVPLPW